MRRPVGWLLALLGFVSLAPLLFVLYVEAVAFLSLDPSSGPSLHVRGGILTVASGVLLTTLLFYGSARCLRRADQ